MLRRLVASLMSDGVSRVAGPIVLLCFAFREHSSFIAGWRECLLNSNQSIIGF